MRSPSSRRFLTAFGFMLLMGLPFHASAVEVTDSRHLLTSMSDFDDPGARPFNTTMACGQSATFDVKTAHCDVRCTQAMCMSKCDSTPTNQAPSQVKLYTDECTDQLTHVFGENGLIVEVPKSEFDQERGFWLMPFLGQIGQFIQPEPVSIDVNFAMPHTARRINNGKMEVLPVYQIFATMNFGPGLSTEDVEIWLAPSLPGVSQIVRFASGNDVFMSLHGLLDF